MRYKRNWAWECSADVFFNDGTEARADAQTNNKGRLTWIKLDGTYYYVGTPEFEALGIREIHFTAPVMLKIA